MYSPSFPRPCCTLEFVNGMYPNPAANLTLSPAASVSPYTALHKHSPSPPSLLPLPPFSWKAEICRHSSNGKLSPRPRQVSLTDRIHRDIMGFLLWNFEPGTTEWPIGLQPPSRKVYIEIRYKCFSQTYGIRTAVGFNNVLVYVPWITSLAIMPPKLWAPVALQFFVKEDRKTYIILCLRHPLKIQYQKAHSECT